MKNVFTIVLAAAVLPAALAKPVKTALNDARAEVIAMSKLIAKLSPGAIAVLGGNGASKDQYAIAEDIAKSIMKQGKDFAKVTSTFPHTPSSAYCASVSKAFSAYVSAFDGAAPALAALSLSPAMKTIGHGSQGPNTDIGADVYKALLFLQEKGGGNPASAAQNSGFFLTFTELCNGLVDKAVETAQSATLEAAVTACGAAYVADFPA